MQTPAPLSALPPVNTAAELINLPPDSPRAAAAIKTSITTGRIAIASGFLLLGLAILVLAALTPAGHDVPDANSFLTFP